MDSGRSGESIEGELNLRDKYRKNKRCFQPYLLLSEFDR